MQSLTLVLLVFLFQMGFANIDFEWKTQGMKLKSAWLTFHIGICIVDLSII